MFEIFLTTGLSKLLLGSAPDAARAQSMAAKWSEKSDQEVQVWAAGESNPRWIYRRGVIEIGADNDDAPAPPGPGRSHSGNAPH